MAIYKIPPIPSGDLEKSGPGLRNWVRAVTACLNSNAFAYNNYAPYSFGTVTTDQTINFDNYSYAQITLGGNVTLSLKSSSDGYRVVYIELTQDGTGSRTVTWTTTNLHFPGSIEPTLSSGTTDIDLLEFVWNGSYYQLSNAIFDLQT